VRHGGITAMQPLYALSGSASRLQVCLKHLINRFHFPSFCCRKHFFNDPGNFIEANLTFKERCDRNFIRCVQSDRMGASGFCCLVGQSEAPKFPHIRRVEV